MRPWAGEAATSSAGSADRATPAMDHLCFFGARPGLGLFRDGAAQTTEPTSSCVICRNGSAPAPLTRFPRRAVGGTAVSHMVHC